MLPEDRQVLKYGFGVLAWVSTFLLVFFLYWPYAYLQKLFTEFDAEAVLLETINHYGYTAQTHTLARVMLICVAVGSLVAIFLLSHPHSATFFRGLIPLKTIGFFSKKLWGQWQAFPIWEKWMAGGALLILTGVRLYFLSQARIDSDEVTTYNLFLSRSLPGILLYYPFPNNHVLYNLLCYGFGAFFSSPFLLLKLPALLLSTVGVLLFYLSLRSAFTFPVVFSSVFALGFSFYPLLYSTLGRGYWLQLLCSGLLAIAVLKLVQRREVYYWLVFLLTSIAGFYAIPTFLYPWSAMVVFAGLAFLISKNRKGLTRLVVLSFFAGFCTLLLYAPIMLASGAKQLYANDFVVRLTWSAFLQKLPVFLPYAQGAMLGQETVGAYLWLVCFLVVSALLLYRKRCGYFMQTAGLSTQNLAWLWCGTFIPWVIILGQGVAPPERTLIFKTFFDFLLVAVVAWLVLQWVFRKQEKVAAGALLLGLLGYSTYETLKLHRQNTAPSVFDYAFNEIVDGIWQSKPAFIFSNNYSSFYMHYLRFRYISNRETVPEIDNRTMVPGREYDFLVVEAGHPFPDKVSMTGYELWAENPYGRIYKKRN